MLRNKKPRDSGAVIHQEDPIARLLQQPMLIIERNIQTESLLLGIVIRHKYKIRKSDGRIMGYIEERNAGFGAAISRQITTSQRQFVIDVFDTHGVLLLTVKRPMKLVNSKVTTMLPNKAPIGESVQKWHLYKKKYKLLVHGNQFASIESPYLEDSFTAKDPLGRTLAAVETDSNWSQMITEQNIYTIRWDPWAFQGTAYYPIGERLSLDEKAVMLANIISIDYDHFTSSPDEDEDI
jgi:hypothetical protein